MLVAAVAILALAFRHVDFHRALSLLHGLGAAVLLIPLPFLAGIAIDTACLSLLLRNLGHAMALPGILRVRFATEAVVLSVSGGAVLADGLAPYLFSKYGGIPVPVGVVATMTRKCLLVLSQAFYIAIAFFAGQAFLADVSLRMSGAGGLEWLVPVTAALMLAISLVMTAMLLRGSVAEKVHGLLLRVPSRRLLRWLDRFRHNFLETDRHLSGTGVREVVLPAVLYVAHWLTEAIETYLIIRLLGVELGFAEVMAVETLLSLLRHIVFFVPSGLGFQDVGYVAFLHAAGVPEAATVGAAFVVLKRSKELFFGLLGYAAMTTPFRQRSVA